MPSRVPTFDRSQQWLGSTWSYQRFRVHQTEINQLYWSFAPAAGFSDYVARHAKPASPTATVFHASGPDVHRIRPAIEEWLASFRDFNNWVRMASALSAASYLEVYLRSAITTALLADPLCRFGKPLLMDGIVWLKHGLHDDIGTLVRNCLIGEWPRRAAEYKKLFKFVPAEIVDNLGDLEQLRRTRNIVGHAFGRPLKRVDEPLMSDSGSSERLSERRFKRWLGLIEVIAKSVDKHLGKTHIGEFETLWFFHRWRVLPRPAAESKYTQSRALARELNRLFSKSPGQEFCHQLIEYYNSQ
jgi:hypothetical protein